MAKKQFGIVAVPNYAKENYIPQSFKGQVSDKTMKFPKKLGVEHPFDFKIAEDLYSTFGYVTGFIDKHVDSIVGNFSAKAKSENVQALIDSFLIDTSFQVTLREWIRSALITGNGFMELDLDNSQIRVLDPKEMYVKRDIKGNVKLYNQYKGNLNRVNAEILKEVIEFQLNEIAHLKINTFPLDAYGFGIIKPNFKAIDNFLGFESDLHKVVSRKAGAPYHVKVGIPGAATSPSTITSFANDMQYLTNMTEWTTDANVDIKMLDAGDLGKGFDSVLNHDKLQLIAGFQVPEVMMGSGQLNEGIAKVQKATFDDQRIRSLQEEVEKVIEEKIFKPLLANQKGKEFQEHVEFEWNLPSEEAVNQRIDKLTALLGGTIQIGENLKRMAEIEIAKALGLEYENLLREPEVGLDDKMEEEQKAEKQAFMDAKTNPQDKENPEKKKEENIKQPEVPGAKPSAKAKHECIPGCGCGQQIEESVSAEMTLKDWANLQELRGFTYSDYVTSILKILKLDQFTDLAAITEMDLDLGLLPSNDINKLREIFKEGFKKNLTIKQIEKKVGENIDLKDRLRINEQGEKVLSVASQNRPNMIARTEASRLANHGLLNHYKENKIDKVQFLAALSERTCPICEGYNSQVFPINESSGLIPLHSNCRCTWIPVV